MPLWHIQPRNVTCQSARTLAHLLCFWPPSSPMGESGEGWSRKPRHVYIIFFDFDIFVDFYHELETTKLWFRSNREDHPHVFRSQVARKKSPLYMQGTLATLRSDHSPVFRDHCDAFRSLLDHLILSCTKPDEQQLFKYLIEVQILADSMYEVVF